MFTSRKFLSDNFEEEAAPEPSEVVIKHRIRFKLVLQGALSELYAPAPSPAVPQLAPPPFATVAPSSPMLQPNGLGAMRLSDETAGLLYSVFAGGAPSPKRKQRFPCVLL